MKNKLKTKKDRWFTYFIFLVDDTTLVHQRIQKDIWQDLYEFYLVETEKSKLWKEEDISAYLKHRFSIENAGIRYISPELSQQLTHQTVHAVFIKVKLSKKPFQLSHYNWFTNQQIKELAFPKIINEYLHSTSFPATLF